MKVDDVLLTRDAAKRLGLATVTLRVWRQQGKGPPWIRPGEGKFVLYPADDLERWIRENRNGKKS